MPESEDLWALKQSIEENPSDHELRWKVAKSFYAACEYRHALEELQILRNEWEPRLNVVRYLSATYYRLGRYEEAIRELRSGISTWPTEIVLQEQLARVLEVSGNLLGAAQTWEGVAKLEPSHPLANSAAKRLQRKAEGKYAEQATDLTLDSQDSGINLKPGQTCSNCGAHNALDAELCWQCQSPIYTVRTPRPSRRTGKLASPQGHPNVLRFAGGAVTVLVLAMCVYLTIRDLAAMGDPVESIQEFYRHTLAPTRVVLGAGLLLIWPLTFYLLLFAIGVPRIPLGTVTIAGLCMAGVAYWLSFSSPAGLAIGLAAALIASVAIFHLGFQLKPKEIISVWLYQSVIIVVAMVVLVTLTEWSRTGVFFNPVRDIPALSRTARMPLRNPELLFSRDLSAQPLPFRCRIQWESSGSPWIDRYAESIFLEIDPREQSGIELDFLNAAGSTIGYETQLRNKETKSYPVDAGQPYTLKLTGAEGAFAGVRIMGILPHRLLPLGF